MASARESWRARVYGLLNLKLIAKCALSSARARGKSRAGRTYRDGNYNELTAKFTRIWLYHIRSRLMPDCPSYSITSLATPTRSSTANYWYSPLDLRRRLRSLLEREAHTHVTVDRPRDHQGQWSIDPASFAIVSNVPCRRASIFWCEVSAPFGLAAWRQRKRSLCDPLSGAP